jgi:hypothetical protein
MSYVPLFFPPKYQGGATFLAYFMLPFFDLYWLDLPLGSIRPYFMCKVWVHSYPHSFLIYTF